MLDYFRKRRSRDKHTRFKIKRRLFIALLFLSLLFGWIAIGLFMPWFETTFSAPSLSARETPAPQQAAALRRLTPSVPAL
ncbi:hypothetical protein [Aurantimonas sp. HBX-1]|uniref:hypothetical protein n=1 Tax=Aurantimonas sp. HBX-1 TaxID=2906072 RepID=UPI001F1BD076|nr:hypothetical protein [Aurantimonas sp. HBX-1]UIJ73338.1 hypothetical protein LXB15_06775 [Aurantimonas sp. HBX-1]